MKKIIILFIFFIIAITSYAQNTSLKTIEEKGNLLEVKLYYDTGELMQFGFYTNKEKLLHGCWESFNKDGSRQCVAFYNKGIKVGTWMYYKGNEITRVVYENNKITSVEKMEHENKPTIDF
ncbi:nicotinic acid mononucleotide adenyltransferase [Lutibacter sp. TH_r2]|uniref:nicotinic acid mononucleotide adenyltransferase n=1 Tax=Lutibacter sp. TH_r2 TaxID=3082083 RepID=UPI002954BFB5|nr:nicotinic acid mononucleotide adenyltransferase [Lutibacter sp. TH_r2]MDV7186194.1 nicotinic acid mononucleotide adenyltransferase [Lutibacter sp. TH_r2]